jgi:hypothetical protein
MNNPFRSAWAIGEYRRAYEPRPIIIYLITCRKNGKMYVGLTNATIEQRFKGHHARRFCGGTGSLGGALVEHGINFFICKELERFDASEAAKAAKAEQLWIAKLETRNPQIGFNLNRGGSLGVTGTGERYVAGGLVFFGIQQMADFTGRSYGTIARRLSALWTPDQACDFDPPPRQCKLSARMKEIRGKVRSRKSLEYAPIAAGVAIRAMS